MAHQAQAITAYDAMLVGTNFTLPVVDLTGSDFQLPTQVANALYTDVAGLEITDLTSGTVGGDGAFDKIMSATKAHLTEEWTGGRITGEQYSKAYIQLTTAALTTATQFLLGKDAAQWQAILLQAQARRAEIDAVTAAVNLENAKTTLAATFFQMQGVKADYALTKYKLATEDAQIHLIEGQTTIAEYQGASLIPAQKALVDAQEAQAAYQTANTLPQQLVLLQEQTEVQRAQTMDTRTDGTTTVVGSVGKQKSLYDQQIDAYVKDAEYKAGKMYLDAWITQKTLDDTLLAPNELTNATVDSVLATIRTNNNLGTP